MYGMLSIKDNIMKSKIGIRRLRKLQDRLREINPLLFYMGEWGFSEHNGKPACGTAACALGWATSIPSFRKQGLRMYTIPDSYTIGVELKSISRVTSNEWNVKNAKDTSIAAAMKFFRLNRDQVYHIFLTDVLDTSTEGIENAIKRIDNVIEGRV